MSIARPSFHTSTGSIVNAFVVLYRSRPYPTIKLMLVGHSRKGKSTLLTQLRKEGTGAYQEQDYQQRFTDRMRDEPSKSALFIPLKVHKTNYLLHYLLFTLRNSTRTKISQVILPTLLTSSHRHFELLDKLFGST